MHNVSHLFKTTAELQCKIVAAAWLSGLSTFYFLLGLSLSSSVMRLVKFNSVCAFVLIFSCVWTSHASGIEA